MAPNFFKSASNRKEVVQKLSKRVIRPAR